jgi:hypothetical protein
MYWYCIVVMEPIDINVCDVPKYIPAFVHLGYSKLSNAGLGVFATASIKKGAFLGNYMGEILCKIVYEIYRHIRLAM